MIRRFAFVCILFTLPGCLTPGEYIPTMRYPIEAEPQVSPGTPGDAILGMRTLSVALPYNLQMVVYQGSGSPLSYIPHSEWAERPEIVVTRALLDALVATHRFADVGDASSMRPPDYILTGEIRSYRENRSKDIPTAEIEVRLELRNALKPGSPWSATLYHSVPLAKDSARELAIAMTSAVEAIAEEAAAEIASLNLEIEKE